MCVCVYVYVCVCVYVCMCVCIVNLSERRLVAVATHDEPLAIAIHEARFRRLPLPEEE